MSLYYEVEPRIHYAFACASVNGPDRSCACAQGSAVDRQFIAQILHRGREKTETWPDQCETCLFLHRSELREGGSG